MTERPPVNVVTIAAGVCFIALGCLLLMHRQGIIELREIIDLWPVALILLGGAIAWQATRGGETASRSGGAIGALVWLGIVGMLFSYTADRRARIESLAASGRVDVFALMAGQRQLDRTGAFRGGSITTVMGGAQLDLRQVTIPPGEEAVLDVFTIFGGSHVYVPTNWDVEIAAMTIAAGVDDQRRPVADGVDEQGAEGDAGDEVAEPATEPAGVSEGDEAATESLDVPSSEEERPRLVITGTILMGGLKIEN